MKYKVECVALLLWAVAAVPGYAADVQPAQPEKWAPITISFSGPSATELDVNPNPFLDFRLEVTLTGPSGQTYVVPGFFDGDGNGGGSGNIWRIRFSADEVGSWSYVASFRSGNEVALDLDPMDGTPASFDGESGSFDVAPVGADATGFLSAGKLTYDGTRYLKTAEGGYWIKSGADSPENWLGYNGFDGTDDNDSTDAGGKCNADDSAMVNGLHSFAEHEADFQVGDPYFERADNPSFTSRGIIGALNYLSGIGVNSISLLPMNLGGDGCDTYPYVEAPRTEFNKTHFDISKMAQWTQVMQHAQRRGIQIQFFLAEAEDPNKKWMDNGSLATERTLFFRELTARFGHILALKWTLMEETEWKANKLTDMAGYLRHVGWAGHPISTHTKRIRNVGDSNLDLYETLYGAGVLQASSLQVDKSGTSAVVEDVLAKSTAAGETWVVDVDEQTFSGLESEEEIEIARKQVIWDTYFSGGNLELYTKRADQTLEDFRTYEAVYEAQVIARRFMDDLPFHEMMPHDELLTGESSGAGGGEVLAKPGEIYAIYFPKANDTGEIDLSEVTEPTTLRWFNPRTGEFTGSPISVDPSSATAMPAAPSDPDEDWVALIEASTTTFIGVTMRASLQGAFEGVQMRSGRLADLPLAHPFSEDPWLYEGQESVSQAFLDANPGIVDWVLIELQDGVDGPVVSRRACFLMQDGQLLDTDGSNAVSHETSPGDFYLVVRSRNHLAVRSATPVTID